MTTAKRRRARKSAEPAKTMADYAMSFERLGLWMSERAKSTTLRHPQATSLSMLDGAIAAVVAGPVSMMPEEWVCPLLGVDPDDFNHDTETFSAIAATLMRHNAISNTLSTKPESFEPLFVGASDGEVDARPWCMGFYAVVKLRLLTWSRLMSPNAIEHRLLLPILSHCVDTPVARFSTSSDTVSPIRPSPKTRGAAFQPSSKLCGSSGCRPGSPRARNFPQTRAEQGYPRTAYLRSPWCMRPANLARRHSLI
jgi:yecA family protein